MEQDYFDTQEGRKGTAARTHANIFPFVSGTKITHGEGGAPTFFASILALFRFVAQFPLSLSHILPPILLPCFFLLKMSFKKDSQSSLFFGSTLRQLLLLLFLAETDLCAADKREKETGKTGPIRRRREKRETLKRLLKTLRCPPIVCASAYNFSHDGSSSPACLSVSTISRVP